MSVRLHSFLRTVAHLRTPRSTEMRRGEKLKIRRRVRERRSANFEFGFADIEYSGFAEFDNTFGQRNLSGFG